MRHLYGNTADVIGRRWAGVHRMAVITLARDPYAATPGPATTVYAGERTAYRPSAWLQDDFARPDGPLGAGYTAIGPGCVIVGGLVQPAGLVVPAGVLHDRALNRAQWAELTLAVLDPGAEAGLWLRAAPPQGYRAVATAAGVRLERVDAAGTVTGLATAATAWQPWDRLRATLDHRTLRVYRNDVLLAEAVDPTGPDPGVGQAGLHFLQPAAGVRVGVTDFLGGPLRQEYIGLVLDMGDPTLTLGLQEPTANPQTFDVSLTNRQPIGEAPSFAAMIRHGQNTQRTYDLPGSPIRVLTEFADASAPVVASTGLVEHAENLSETGIRLRCRGRDAFLEPLVDAATVTYLPGPPLLGGGAGPAPIPEDPCAPAPAPIVLPGEEPDEPDDDIPEEGVGPEAPEDPEAAEEEEIILVGLIMGPRIDAQSEGVPAAQMTDMSFTDRRLTDEAEIKGPAPLLYIGIIDAISPPPEGEPPPPAGTLPVEVLAWEDQRTDVDDFGPRRLTDTYNGVEDAPLLYLFEIEAEPPPDEEPA